ncbi:MAG TPA: class I SAM-dependent methyltransferase [Nocardioidaceae bacterium]|nr:class I SAM-dependent methyltransferase [Nocardioidaceae bacterium]
MSANQQQSEAWNGAESAHYVDHADRYDRQLAPFTDALFESVQLEPHHSVLDVGCGTGATTLTAVRAARTALGADISRPLLEVAADRARSASIDNAEFVVADAQTYAFAEGAFDIVISQFGLMFFDDPISAFTNLRRALAPGGRAAFICWQGLEANEWVMVVGRAVAQHVTLPDLGGLAGGPGMFALEDPDETAALLDAAGFTQIEFEPLSPTVLLGGGGTLDESIDFLLGTGIARGLLGLAEPDARAAAIEAVRAALAERYEPGVGVPLGTGAWLVTARK